jgi:hypothetical protein
MDNTLIMIEMDMTKPADQKRILNIWNFCDESKFSEEYRCQYSPKDARFIYILFDTLTNRVVGRMAFNISINKNSQPKTVMLINIATENQSNEKTNSKRKLGTVMIKYLIDKSKDIGAKKISLVSDFRSTGFYEKLGFVKERFLYVYRLD